MGFWVRGQVPPRDELVGVMRWLQVRKALSNLTSENPSVATPWLSQMVLIPAH